MKIRISLTQDFNPVNKKVPGDGEINDWEIENYVLDYEAAICMLNDGDGTLTIEEVYDEETDDNGIVTTRSKCVYDVRDEPQ